MLERITERFVFSVAQEPFDAPSRNSWETNTFCSLLPVLDGDNEIAEPLDFPNCGLVWWMVLAKSAGYAEPGRLVAGTLQKAVKWEEHEPTSMLYQVDVHTVDPVTPRTGVEILTIPTNLIAGIDELLNRKRVFQLDHHPTAIVFARWNGVVYGPWRVTAESDTPGTYSLSFVPESASTVFEISGADFHAEYGKSIRTFSSTITDERSNPKEAYATRIVNYELLVGEALEKLRRAPHRTVKLTSDEEALRSLARNLLNRAARQEFVKQMENLIQLAHTRGEEGVRVDAALRILERQKSEVAVLDEVAESVLRSGLLDDAVHRAAEAAAKAYVEQNATTLYADVVKRSGAEQKRLVELIKQREKEESELEAFRARVRQELDSELRIRRSEAEAQLRDERLSIEKSRHELDEQREIAGKQLTALAERFTANRQELIQDFLAIRPLLEQVGLSDQKTRSVDEPPNLAVRAQAAEFNFPAFLYRDDDENVLVDEQEFFERFQQVVASRGFEHKPLDLVNFHIAVKTNDLTILGGFSGTGKSSLVEHYARALGGNADAERDRFLQVWVSPSWLDSKDLLGHINALSQSFQPSESRLFEFIAIAQEEHERRGANSGVHLVCLDEMNLSQVEHYFGAFLQALPSSSREVPVFDAGSVSSESPYRRFATLRLSPALRFVGTVNFDETTRQLSLRLLDRADLIRLRAPEMANITRAADRSGDGARIGSPVKLRHLRSWTRDGALKTDLATALDELRPSLELLGCPLTPRRYRAIRRFVSSAVPLCTEQEAFDLQIANRILPQVRNVLTSSARGALDSLRRTLEVRQFGESLAMLDSSLADLANDGVA